MQLVHLGLALAFAGGTTAFQQTVIPCGDDGNTISTCTVTATDQVVTLSRTVSTASTTITQSLAARRVERVVVPAYSERYCLAQYKDLGPIALPEWDGSGICGSRCDPPENDQYVQTVRVVECKQNARQSTKVCSEHLETWSRTATGMTIPATMQASTRYACNSAGQYTFQFSDIAPRTYTVLPGSTTVTRLRNGRVTTLYGKPTTVWYEQAPYTVQITKVVNRPTVINFTTRITTNVCVYLPTSTVTATATITYTKTVTGRATTTARPSSTSSVKRTTTTRKTTTRTTTTTKTPSATATPSQFYLRVRYSITEEFRYVRFENGQAKLVTEQDAIYYGVDMFTVTYGFLRSLPRNGGAGFGYLIGTAESRGTVLIRQYNGFPPGGSQLQFTPTGTEEYGYLIDAISFGDAEGLCVDSEDNLYVIYSAENNNCVQRIVFFAVPRIAGVAPTSTPPASYNTVTTVYRGTGTLSPTPFTSTVARPSNGQPGTVQVLYNPSTITRTVTDSGTNTRTSTISEQSGSTPGTVEIHVPAPTSSTTSVRYVTITTVYRGTGTLSPTPFTSTIAPSGTAPGTIEILYNPTTVTRFITTPGNGARFSSTRQQSGSVPGTIDVFVPSPTSSTASPTFVTITAIYRGTGTLSPTPYTSTIPPSGTAPGTIEILYNPSTITRTFTDTGSNTRTSTTQQIGSTPGTVDIFVPRPVATTTVSASYITVTTVYRGTGTLSPTPSTSTIAQPSGTNPGTVEIFYNPNTITSTILDSGNTTRTSTLAEQAGATAGTVNILLPRYLYRTVTSGSVYSSGTVTPASGTRQGTILVIVPTSSAAASPTTTVSAYYITISTVYRGTGTLSPSPSTSTIAQPSGTSPGTVEIFYNPSTITTTTLQGDSTRTTTIEQTGSTPGTVEVFLPAYVTTSYVYRGTGTLSQDASTSTIAQPTGTTPGTVAILYNPRTVTITTIDDSATAPRTSTITEQVGATAGTVEVFLPNPSYVTISTVYRGSPTLAQPSTTTLARPTGTTPGTVEVFYNPSTITITSAFGNGTAPSTSTIAEQAGTTAGTVEVFIPAYVTRTTTSGSVGSTSTLSNPSGASQGTILVIVPTATTTTSVPLPTTTSLPSTTLSYITITTTSGSIASTTTIQTPSGTNPGTVLVIVPVTTTISTTSIVPSPTPSYITITTTSGAVGSTTTIQTASGTNPGTVLVVVPVSTTISSTSFAPSPTPSYVTITTTSGAVSTTSTIQTASGTVPGTVLVIVPVSTTPAPSTTLGYATITTTSGTVSTTSTIQTPSGSTSGTVLVIVPVATTTLTTTLSTTLSYVTITTTSGSVSTTSTVPPSGTAPGTVFVIVPVSTTISTTTSTISAVYVTVTRVYRGTGTVTQPSSTTVAQPTGTAPGTVEVYYNPNTITITSLDSGNTTRTTTLNTQTGTDTATVEVLLPSYVTITSTSGASAFTSTSRVATGTTQGTVVVFVPVSTTTTTITAVYTTITTVYRGTGTISPNPSTTTLVRASGTTTGTVEIFYNPNTITITSLDAGNTTRTTTLSQQQGSTAGTVEVLLPSYVTRTITSGYVGGTTTLNTPSGTVQGTVQVIRPATTVVYCSLNGASTAPPDPAATGAGSNRGVQYGVWDSPFFDYPPFDENTGFANYNTTYFDAAGRGANYTGSSPSITYSASSSQSTKAIYADTPRLFSTNNITLIHRGFLFARTAGTYTFQTINPDDIVEVWVGDLAISGFTRQNAKIAKAYPAGTTSYTIALTAGQYMPFRIQWANGGVPASLSVRILSPTGQVLLDGTTSTDIVTQACDGSTPQLPKWYTTAGYVTTTTTSGYATTTGTTTVASPVSGTPGTVRVVVPTPIYCTSTTAVSSNAPGASATSNVGLQYGIWNNTAQNPPPFPSNQRDGYPQYNVSAFDNRTAVHVGTTNLVGFPLTGSNAQPNQVFQIYDDAPRLRYNIGYITIIHRGFLFARQTGTYTFTSASSDDITFLWTGQKAINGFTRANADLIQSYYAVTNAQGQTVQQNTPVSFSIALTQGQYLPIRIQWADAGPPGELNMNVTGPDGGFRIRRGQAMADVVDAGCGGSNATTPAFPPWRGTY